MFANLLPRRLWPEWEGRIPIARMGIPSAMLTMVLAGGLGVPGFLRYATRTADESTAMMLEAAGRQMEGRLPQKGEVTTAMPVSISALSLLAFLFFTPLGLVSLYLGVTGLYRLAGNVGGDPHGDPILTVADHLVRTRRRNAAQDLRARARERLEGPAVPDVLLTGADLGLSETDYALVASRRKPGWERGVVVVTGEKWYKIGEPFDQRFPGGLRTIYPLTEKGAVEVVRRAVAHELPRLSELDPASQKTRLKPAE